MTKTLLTLGAMALLASPSLLAAQDSLQEHLRIEQQLQKKYQKRLKEGTGSSQQYQYKYQHQYKYNGTNPNRSSMGSSFGQRSGGGGRH